MTDAEWVKSLNDIHDIRTALCTLYANTGYFNDPYYKDLAIALDRMVHRVLKENPAKALAPTSNPTSTKEDK